MSVFPITHLNSCRFENGVLSEEKRTRYTTEEIELQFEPKANQGDLKSILFIAYYYFLIFEEQDNLHYGKQSETDLEEELERIFDNIPQKKTGILSTSPNALSEDVDSNDAQEDYSVLNKSIEWFEKAKRKGNMDALRCLEEIYWVLSFRYSKKRDCNKAKGFKTRSINCLKQLAVLGDSESQYEIGIHYLNNNKSQQGVQWLEAAAGNGEYRGVDRIADYYYNNSDYKTAFKWYKLIMDSLDEEVINSIISTEKSMSNNLICQNEKKANNTGAIPLDVLKYIIDSPELFKRLGIIYSNGFGTEPDAGEAIHWFKIAAEAGDLESCNSVGIRYYVGSGVEIDETEACKWFQKAADGGLAEAQFNLATYYEDVKGDMPKAIFWYYRSAAQGNREALKALYYYTEFEESIDDEIGLAHFLKSQMERRKPLPLLSGGIIYNNCVHGGLYLNSQTITKD